MNKFMAWVDARFPATKMWEDHLSKYYAPKNFNFWYFFGSLALLVLVNQILTGIWLTMSFTPSLLIQSSPISFRPVLIRPLSKNSSRAKNSPNGKENPL